MKSIISKAGIYLIDFIAALWIGVLFAMVAVTPIRLIFEPSVLQERICWGILQALGTVAWLLISAGKIGYEQKTFRISSAVIPSLFPLAVQALVVYPFRFAMYISGPASYLADAIYWGNRQYHWERWVEVPLYIHFGLIFAFDILYLAAVIAGEYIGSKKRIRDRDKLIDIEFERSEKA